MALFSRSNPFQAFFCKKYICKQYICKKYICKKNICKYAKVLCWCIICVHWGKHQTSQRDSSQSVHCGEYESISSYISFSQNSSASQQGGILSLKTENRKQHHNKAAYHQNEIDAFLPYWTLISNWQFNEITPFIETFQNKQYQLTYNSGVVIQIGFFGHQMDHMTF